MQTAHISIGRTNDKGTQVLTPTAWDRFRAEVRNALRLATSGQVFAGEWSGTTHDERGVSEESAHFQTVGDVIYSDQLRATLADIAAIYGQRSVALTLGTSELIERN